MSPTGMEAAVAGRMLVDVGLPMGFPVSCGAKFFFFALALCTGRTLLAFFSANDLACPGMECKEGAICSQSLCLYEGE